MNRKYLTYGSSFVVLASAATAIGAQAAEGGLYDAPPPPDVAFVRVLNADVVNDAELTLNGTAYDVAPGAISPYEYVLKGNYDATLASGTLSVSLNPQRYYTILVPGDGSPASLLEDKPLANPTRAGLYFYNATDKPLQLDARIKGEQAPIFKDILPGATAFREVSPLEVSFVLMAGGASAFELPATAMVRQQGISVVALPAGTGVTAIQAANTVDTE